MTVATAIKSRPIIMATESVRAILDGRKTQTRRVVKLPDQSWEPCNRPASWGDQKDDPIWSFYTMVDPVGTAGTGIRCPYGVPGDLLWVRETFYDSESAGGNRPRFCYRADRGELGLGECWRSPLFMPRLAARLWLLVVKVRVERVQTINGFDACLEGYPGLNDTASIMHHGEGKKARRWFRVHWDSLNAKRGYSWDSNPWVWVVTFERAEKPA